MQRDGRDEEVQGTDLNPLSQTDTPQRMFARKNDHIRICTQEKVESVGNSFQGVELLPEAVPDFDISEVDTARSFLGTRFSLPIFMTGMTGGVERGQEINETLAYAAQKHNIAMGLGSQKILIHRPDLKHLFEVRKVAPKVFLIGNLGVVSFNYGVTIDDVKRLVDDFQLNAFALHTNALQECVQWEGERNFSNSYRFISEIVRALPVPVIVKEVGSGIGPQTFRRLAECGVAAIDVGGRGGTSWSAIEGMRGDKNRGRLGELFRNWGLSTDQSLRLCVEEQGLMCHSKVEVLATGGIRDGIQVAKAVALGASLVGIGLPFFKAVVSPPVGQTSLEALESELKFFEESLRISLFCTGSRTLDELKSRVM